MTSRKKHIKEVKASMGYRSALSNICSNCNAKQSVLCVRSVSEDNHFVVNPNNTCDLFEMQFGGDKVMKRNKY